MAHSTRTNSDPQEGELLDVDGATRLLGVHRNTLYRLIRTDDLPALRLSRGGRWRFRRQDLLDWIEARQARRVA
ncbi:MAG: helix-turn-helix domain-containing protein [Phycisphaerales bacterium]|nr:helix-turn-helix domain-containing protein [Phycisphaerales bacterium]